MNIAIIGLGLIGGSLAKSIKTYTKYRCWGMDCDQQALTKALADGAIDRKISPEQLKDAQLTIVCLHPQATVEVLLANSDHFNPQGLVIDVCGVKKAVMDAVLPTLKAKGVTFIGTHPMAGREFSGYDYATNDLFSHASFIMTPPENTPSEAIDFLERLAIELGFKRVVITTPAEHDATIAFTSQLAHIVSNGYIKSPTLKNESGFSAGSFLDLTRVARLNPAMWTQLFLYNREALLFEIDTIIKHLEEYQEALVENDGERLQYLLKIGSDLKEESLKGSH